MGNLVVFWGDDILYILETSEQYHVSREGIQDILFLEHNMIVRERQTSMKKSDSPMQRRPCATFHLYQAMINKGGSCSPKIVASVQGVCSL